MRFRSQLGQYLNDLGLCGVGAEIGVFTGLFARQILDRWRGRKLWLIDPWRHQADYLDSFNTTDEAMERRYQLARRRLRPYAGRIDWVRERSEAAATRFLSSSLDFVYIDANHSYAHTRRDLSLWYPKVRPRGLVAGHDYFNAVADAALEPSVFGELDPSILTSYGVKAAVDEFAAQHVVAIEHTAEKFPTWYLIKPPRRAKRAKS